MPCFDHRRNDVYLLRELNETPLNDENLQHSYDFGGHVVPKETVFMTSEHSIAFTNIRCVVPGR